MMIHSCQYFGYLSSCHVTRCMNFFLLPFISFCFLTHEHRLKSITPLQGSSPSLSLLLTYSPSLSPSIFLPSTSIDPFTVTVQEGEKEYRNNRKKKLGRQRVDREDQVEHLIHRKWTEPHKASFLCELAADGGAADEKALLIWIKQAPLFKIPLVWVNQVNRFKWNGKFQLGLCLSTACSIVEIQTGCLAQL